MHSPFSIEIIHQKKLIAVTMSNAQQLDQGNLHALVLEEDSLCPGFQKPLWGHANSGLYDIGALDCPSPSMSAICFETEFEYVTGTRMLIYG